MGALKLTYYNPTSTLKVVQGGLWNGGNNVQSWTTTDPKGQYHSPYVGMGNNPVSNTDPDGGETEPVKFNLKPNSSMSPVKTNYIADIFNYNTTTKTSTHIIKAGADEYQINGVTQFYDDSRSRQLYADNITNSWKIYNGSSVNLRYPTIYGDGWALGGGIGINELSIDISFGYFGKENGKTGQLFFTINEQENNPYINFGVSAQSLFGTSTSGQDFDVSGSGKVYSGGYGLYSGTYSIGLNKSNLPTSQIIGLGIGGGIELSGGFIKTKTYAITVPSNNYVPLW